MGQEGRHGQDTAGYHLVCAEGAPAAENGRDCQKDYYSKAQDVADYREGLCVLCLFEGDRSRAAGILGKGAGVQVIRAFIM